MPTTNLVAGIASLVLLALIAFCIIKITELQATIGRLKFDQIWNMRKMTLYYIDGTEESFLVPNDRVNYWWSHLHYEDARICGISIEHPCLYKGDRYDDYMPFRITWSNMEIVYRVPEKSAPATS